MNPKRPRVRTLRLPSLFRYLDQCGSRLDSALMRWIPHELNLLSHSGAAANFCLLVAFFSGVLLLFWYAPSVQLAHASLESVQGRTLGGWVRALHRYSSDLTMLLVLLHAFRSFAASKFSGSRTLAWVSGVFMLAFLWLIGWTGFWLVWDQPAQQVATLSMRFLDLLPIFPEPLSSLHLADRLVPSLLFFVVFFGHMLLPLLLVVGLVIHVIKLSHVRLFPRGGLMLLTGISLAVVSWLLPAPLDPPAKMAIVPDQMTVDAWYLTPLALGLRFQDLGLWAVLLMVLALAFAVPWIFGCPQKGATFTKAGQTVVSERRCDACEQCVRDCPFDAIRMVERGPSRLSFPTVAWVDPERCVGCAVCVGSCHSAALNLEHLDTLTHEKLLFEQLRNDSSEQLALVASDALRSDDRKLDQLRQSALKGFTVFAVPTASWIRSNVLERLIKRGMRHVLIVRDGSSESAARAGNRWIAERSAGKRNPPLRESARPAIHLFDFTPGRERKLAQFVNALQVERHHSASHRQQFQWVAAAAVVGVVTSLVIALSHLQVQNPADPSPEFALSIKAYGSMQEEEMTNPEDEATKPIHMRGHSTQKPHRSPITIRLTLNGQSYEHSIAARGISRDGPALATLRHRIVPGNTKVKVVLDLGEQTVEWTGSYEARERHIQVLTYHPQDGFVMEP
ncbi:MAG: cytochrome b N-terminal domain-containing protein [Puniceicoccaceae bacterium]